MWSWSKTYRNRHEEREAYRFFGCEQGLQRKYGDTLSGCLIVLKNTERIPHAGIQGLLD